MIEHRSPFGIEKSKQSWKIIVIITVLLIFEEDDSSPGTDEDELMEGGLVDAVSLGKGNKRS